MSNKPAVPTEHHWHDATDPACENHDEAKRHKGIKPNKGRTCWPCYYYQRGGYAA